MRWRRRGIVAAMVLLLAAVPIAAAARHTPGHTSSAKAVLVDAGFRPVGTVDFQALRAGRVRVSYAIHATALTAGIYAMHVHTVGACDPRTQALGSGVSAFASSGGHFKGAGGNHGSHDGDFPPVLVMGDGRAEGSFVTDRLDFGELIDRPDGAPTGGDGSAVVLHARADNFGNIPARYRSAAVGAPDSGPDATTLAAGDAGDRFACGVIQ